MAERSKSMVEEEKMRDEIEEIEDGAEKDVEKLIFHFAVT